MHLLYYTFIINLDGLFIFIKKYIVKQYAV